MTEIATLFPPTLAQACQRLDAFVPHAGSTYAQRRNFDHGPGRHDHVSTLSPYVKIRALDEVAITSAVLAAHSARAADKFIAEVFWRTYWKGWMELRPAVWDQYRQDIKRLQDDVQTQSGLRAAWEQACCGSTGIAAFDSWAQELVQTGYLHNHARMWFASIWIFTLDLPWQLGADFFLRHLLDGDAAVNTLSWRWVAGIQTAGKTYLAESDNIATFTKGRFAVTEGLARRAIPVAAPPPPAPRMLPACPENVPTGHYGVVLHDDDIGTGFLQALAPDPVAATYLDTSEHHSPWQMAPHVSTFRRHIATDATRPHERDPAVTSAQGLADWAAERNLDHIVAPYAPVGPVRDIFTTYRTLTGAVPLTEVRRPLDTHAWPLATKGFFPFRSHIPDLIKSFVRG